MKGLTYPGELVPGDSISKLPHKVHNSVGKPREGRISIPSFTARLCHWIEDALCVWTVPAGLPTNGTKSRMSYPHIADINLSYKSEYEVC